MKKLMLFFSLCLLALFLLTGCGKGSTDWVKYKTDHDGNTYSYDQKSLKKDAAKNTVEVCGKETYSDTGRTIELQARIKDGLSVDRYENLAEKVCLYVIDCQQQKFKILSINHYDKDGKVLLTTANSREEKMFDIPAGATMDALKNEVCAK
jgi:hypothetical protein